MVEEFYSNFTNANKNSTFSRRLCLLLNESMCLSLWVHNSGTAPIFNIIIIAASTDPNENNFGSNGHIFS